MDQEAVKKPFKWKTWHSVVGFAAVIALFIVGQQLIAAEQQRRWAEASGTVHIRLTGATSGEGWSMRASGDLETWAEHAETVLHVYVGRSPLGPPSETPFLTVELDDGTVCETYRSYMWSTDQGSNLDLRCEYYLTLDTIQQIESGRVLD